MTAEHRAPPTLREVVLDGLLQRMPVTVFAASADGVCTYSEGAGLGGLGLRAGEMVGADLFEVFARMPRELGFLKEALAGRAVSYSWRSDNRAFDTWLSPLHDEGGALDGLMGISVDATDRVRAEDDLLLHQAFVEASPQFVALADADGSIRYVNPGGRRMAGVPDDVDVTRTTLADYLTEEGRRLRVEVEQPSVLAQGSYEGESTLRHWPSGRGIPVRVSTFLVTDRFTGEPRALATVRTDMSAQVEARRETERLLSHQRGLLLHLHQAQETERRRIAHEVHDDTIQALAAVNIRVQSVRRQLEAAGALETATMLGPLGDSVGEATQRLRQLLYELDVPERLDEDLVSALGDHAGVVCAGTGFTCTVRGSLRETPPVHVARVLFRIAQEALANVRAHADPTQVLVEVGERDHGFTLTVRDDGRGLAPSMAAPARGRPQPVAYHLGLRGMAERAESVGGWCSVRGLGVEEGRGTLVEAWVPTRLDYSASAAGSAIGSSGAARSLMEQTVESISEGFAAIDRDWRYVYVNQVGADIVRRHDLPGTVCWDQFDFSPETETAYRDAMRLQRPTVARVLYPDLGRWVESRVFPSPEGLAVFFRDVTVEQEAERRAADRERVLTRATRLAGILAAEADLGCALRRAAELIRDTYRLSAVRLSVTGTVDISLGEPAAGDAEWTIPLVLMGRTLGELSVRGARLPDEKLSGVADGIALRVGAQPEPSGPPGRSEGHD